MLTDREFAEIRSAVMSEVRSPQPAVRSPFLALAFASLVVFVVSIFVARVPLTPALSPLRGARVKVAEVAPRPAQRGEGVAQSATGEGRTPKRRRHHPKPKPVQLAAVRMDIQTADPDVRIIWFARQEDSK